MRPGERVRVEAQHADGEVYRWWDGSVEASAPDRLILYAPAGTPVVGTARSWISRHAMRTVYWFDRPYNLHEVYAREERLHQLYIHIAGPPRLDHTTGTLRYVDHELDVVKFPGHEAAIYDEEEFEVASHRYGYTADFQAACRAAVVEALELIERWEAHLLAREFIVAAPCLAL